MIQWIIIENRDLCKINHIQEAQIRWCVLLAGLGYADVENRVPCKADTVMRIASISKSITMTAVAKAMEKGDLDLDKPVQFYVPQFPEKTVNGEKVGIRE